MKPLIASERMHCFRINAPAWYERSDFLKVLNNQHDLINNRPVATWHQSGESADEYSDLFTVYDNGEGELEGILPQDIWEDIKQIVGERYAVVWISPVG